MSCKSNKACTSLNYVEHYLTLAFAVTICISDLTFVSLVYISKGIMSFTIAVNICVIIETIKKYKSIIKKTKKKHNKIALLAKTKLDCIKSLISRSLADS